MSSSPVTDKSLIFKGRRLEGWPQYQPSFKPCTAGAPSSVIKKRKIYKYTVERSATTITFSSSLDPIYEDSVGQFIAVKIHLIGITFITSVVMGNIFV